MKKQCDLKRDKTKTKRKTPITSNRVSSHLMIVLMNFFVVEKWGKKRAEQKHMSSRKTMGYDMCN